MDMQLGGRRQRSASSSLPGMVNWWSHKVFSKTTFLSHHYFMSYVAYLVIVMTTTAVVVYACEGPGHIRFSDAAYLSVSAGTMAGLSSFDFTQTKISTQIVIWLHVILCSPMLLTLVPLVLRRRSFFFQMRFELRRETPVGRALSSGDLDITEYVALGKLLRFVLGYWAGCQLVGWLLLWGFQAFRSGPHTGFWGACWPSLFLATSAFHNCGLSVVAVAFDGVPLAIRVGQMTVVALLILLGNSCFPMALRLLLKLDQRRRRLVDPALELLLDDPRRCYTHLFPGYATLWLSLVTAGLFLMQVVGLFFTESPYFKKAYSPELRYESIVFHSISARTAGIPMCDLSQLSPAAVFVLGLAMWISISPVVVATRSTMKRRPQPEYDMSGGHLEQPPDFTQMKHQLQVFMNDNCMLLGLLFFGILHHERDTFAPTHFHWIVFEFCSSWGTVGLSMGPKAYSFSGDWSLHAQVYLMIVMFLGRLRGLPQSIDPSVSLYHTGTGPPPTPRRRAESEMQSYA